MRRARLDEAGEQASPSTKPLLQTLPEDPYAAVTASLDVEQLCCLDASCRALRSLNDRPCGPWQRIGQRASAAVEASACGAELESGCWKLRCKRLLSEAAELQDIDSECVACCRGRLHADVLCTHPELGVYVEARSCEDSGSILFGVRGGCEGLSSLLFAPEQGLVQEICLEPGGTGWEPGLVSRIRTRLRQLLYPSQVHGCRFSGRAGLYLAGGQVAFFRQLERSQETGCVLWEKTRLVDLPDWARHGLLSVYLGGPGASRGVSNTVRFRCSPP